MIQYLNNYDDINKISPWNTNPLAATKSKSGKIFKSYILILTPKGKCEQPLHKLTVQVWFQYDHLIFKYCTLYVSRRELQSNGQTDVQSDY